jgi:hypothetical protein
VTGRNEDVDQILAGLLRKLPACPAAAGGPAPTSAEMTSPIVFIEPE